MVCVLMEIGKVCGECVNGDWEGDVVSVLMGIRKGGEGISLLKLLILYYREM